MLLPTASFACLTERAWKSADFPCPLPYSFLNSATPPARPLRLPRILRTISDSREFPVIVSVVIDKAVIVCLNKLGQVPLSVDLDTQFSQYRLAAAFD